MKASIQFSPLITCAVYGMFLETGEETATVDVMHYLWNNECPKNRGLRFESASLNGKTARQNIRLAHGKSYPAKLAASDPDKDGLTNSWEILEESRDLKDGRDVEFRPQSFSELFSLSNKPETTLPVPAKTGAYRLFGYVFEGKGGAARVHIPFRVDSPL